MLWEEIRGLDTGVGKLRSFGLSVGAVLLGIALLVLWRRDWTLEGLPIWLGAPGFMLVFAGLIVPAVLTPVYRVWMALALVLGFVMTHVILTIVFYVLITPIGLVMRGFGKDPLNRSIDTSSSSYWIDKEYNDATPKRLEKYY
jgi:hypothetical protein